MSLKTFYIKYVGLLNILLIMITLATGCSREAGGDKGMDGINGEQEDSTSGKPDISSDAQTELTKLVVPEVEMLLDNDFILYYVNCATEATDQIFEGDYMGLFQSVTDKEFGKDAVTGAAWGYQPRDYMKAEGDVSSADRTAAKWVILEGTDYVEGETGFYYDFQLPNGEYEVTCGFNDPFSARTITVVSEGDTKVDKTKILKFRLTEAAFRQEVTDGTLNLFIHNADRGEDPMKDPILSYILVRAVPNYDKETLTLMVDKVTLSEEKRQYYTADSVNTLDMRIESARELLTKEAVSTEEIEEYYDNLRKAYNMLTEIEVYEALKPGQIWTDTDGNLIQAHGGQVQKLTVRNEETGELEEKWWWVGEDKSLGYRGGIRAYSSDDLYNWKFEGVVMRNVSSREQLEEEEYFKELYGDYSREQLDNVYRCINDTTSVIERPKMIYNEKTNKYVLWFHADGPTETSDANYAAACAGVAISDSPAGPFKFIDRYRLNVAPQDQLRGEWYEASRGFARDMNLFVDDDGTAYIVYSSEENRTMFISKLNEEYTYLAAPVEEAVHGIDFVRLFPGAQREAPALFKRNGKYYMITSGATGWDPNQARYYMADSILGEWEDMGDPCVGDTKRTTFDSQSTCVISVDPITDQYIFMADRWNSEDLTNSRYIWLPMEFDEQGRLSITWKDEWKPLP